MKPDGHGTSRYITPSAPLLLSYSEPLALFQNRHNTSGDFYHFAATFGNCHDIESSSTQAGTSISRLHIQVLLPRHERHRAAVLVAKSRRLASVPLSSSSAVHKFDDTDNTRLFHVCPIASM